MLTTELFNGRVRLVTSTKADGNMRHFDEDENSIIANQSKLCTTLGGDASLTARVKTTYANRKSFTEYLAATKSNIGDSCILSPEDDICLADGIATTDKDISILLPLADCLGIVFYNPDKEVLGLLHSGRQNLEEEGARKFVEFLVGTFGCNPQNLLAYYTAHAQNYQIHKLNNISLSEAATEQLIAAGVPSENISGSNIDTVINPDFPSNSSGDSKLRFAVAVKLL